MFIIYGSKGFKKHLGNGHDTVECGNCHNQVQLEALQVGRKFTLFYIPLFTTSSQHYLACPICSAGVEVSREEAEQFINESLQEGE